MAKYKLSLTAEEINARLNKIPNSWSALADQQYNATSTNPQSGKAVAEGIAKNIAELENSVDTQVNKLQSDVDKLAVDIKNIDFNNLVNKPFYSEFNTKKAREIIPPTDMEFVMLSDVEGTYGTVLMFDEPINVAPELPVSVSIDETVINDTIKYQNLSGVLPLYYIGNLTLLFSDLEDTQEDYLVAYIPSDREHALYIVTRGPMTCASEGLYVFSLTNAANSVPVLPKQVFEFSPVAIFEEGVTTNATFLEAYLSCSEKDVYSITIGDNTYENITFEKTCLELTSNTEPDVVEFLGTIYYAGNIALHNASIFDLATDTGEDYLLFYLPEDETLFVGTSLTDTEILLGIDKPFVEAEYFYKLDDNYLAYTETRSGNIIFDHDVFIDKVTSLRELSQTVTELSDEPRVYNTNPDSETPGLSVNKSTFPLNTSVWIEGGAASAEECYILAGATPTSIIIPASSNTLVLTFSSSTYTEGLKYQKLENYPLVSFTLKDENTDENKTYIATISQYTTIQDATVTINLNTIHADDFKGEPYDRQVTDLLFYPKTGNYSHSEGRSIAYGSTAHAEGWSTTALGDYSHAEGLSTTAGDDNAVGSWARGTAQHAEGERTRAKGSCSHAEGESTEALGNRSHAEGYLTTAKGSDSHAEGYSTTASGDSSHAEGSSTTASGNHSHAEGQSTIASNTYTHAEGYKTTASGSYSHAEGDSTTASGQYSHAEGRGTIASSAYQHVQGRFNLEDSSAAHIIGYGSSSSKRANIHTVDWSGNAWYAGSIEAVDGLILKSTTTNSTKRFKITVDDSGTLVATEIVNITV